jgi:hypothetical protein
VSDLEALSEELDQWVETSEAVARLLHRLGGRDSDDQRIRHLAARLLPELEGQDAGWLGGPFAVDLVQEYVAGPKCEVCEERPAGPSGECDDCRAERVAEEAAMA